MSKRSRERREQIARAESRRRKRILMIVIALTLSLGLGRAIPAVRRMFRGALPAKVNPQPPAPVPTPNVPPPANPSKEYIYAGNRLIATEEPAATPQPTPPLAPSSLQAIVWCQVHLTWTDNSSDETGFKIERSTDGGATFTLYTTVEANTTECHSLPRPIWKESAYLYRVRATNIAGDSAASNTVAASPLCQTCRCANDVSASPYGSLAVNGSSSYVNVPNSSSINIAGGPITVEAWVKTNLDGTFFNRVVSRYSETGGGYVLDLYRNRVRFWLLQNVNSADFVDGSTTLSPHTWYHIAGVADGQRMRVYLDGLLDGWKNSDWLPVSSTEPLQLGGVVYGGQFASLFAFNGLIDEVRISASALYDGKFVPPPHLAKAATTRVLWKFDDQTANDASGNGNNGTFMGGAASSTDVPPPRELVVWSNVTPNLTATGNSLSKSGNGWAWDSVATATRLVLSGEGYAEATASETNTYRMFGLAHDPTINFAGLDYGIYLTSENNFQVYESGSRVQIFGPYAAGDRFRVAIESGMVKYSRNGQVFYEHATTPIYPLRMTGILYSPGATLTNAVVAGNLRS